MTTKVPPKNAKNTATVETGAGPRRYRMDKSPAQKSNASASTSKVFALLNQRDTHPCWGISIVASAAF
jgi:hypothetical protein